MWGEIQHDGAGRSPNTSRVRCLITPSNPSRTARSWCGWKPWLRRWLSLFPTRRFSTVRFHSSARSTRQLREIHTAGGGHVRFERFGHRHQR